LRNFLFSLVKRVASPLWGHGISKKLPFIAKIYSLLFYYLHPKGILFTEIHGFKIYVEAKSFLAQDLITNNSFEEDTTKLFYTILKKGMTILDVGANVGYYSLLASKVTGETGKIFAFEPWKGSFILLQRNIESNAIKNIVPVAKAVSNRCGKQILFLASDPGSNSLSQKIGSEFVEVEVTTIDDFVNEKKISVDLIKMDVEGAEMCVLQGMVETIRKNPDIKIITEFSPHHLESSGFSPKSFLEQLMVYGFKLYVLNDAKHIQELITRENMNCMINLCRKKLYTNIFCERKSC
jgi:FkbM family methyltransferase